MGSTKRKLATGSVAAAVFATGVGASVLPASADQRTLVVTLLGGQTVTVTVDVPPGTPLDQITIPGITTPIVGISEVGSGPAPQQTQTETQTQAQPQGSTAPTTTSTAPTTTSTGPAAGSPQDAPAAAGGGKRRAQKTTGAATPVAGGGALTEAERKAKDETAKTPGGAPTPGDPTFSLALPGPAPVGVPNFFIDKFRVPPFLLPIYQAAGIEYGVRWEVLAAINEIETDYGRNLTVSTAGAVGWMQFLPETWKQYGVDANHDGTKDPYNPVDAIFGAARYLKAAGADKDLRAALFSYNHADWYVDSVVLRARLLGGLPADFVGSITGLTQGHFPVAARASYADDLSERDATRRIKLGHNAAVPVLADAHRRSIDIFSRPGAAVIAVQDGKVIRIGENKRLGRFLMLRDAYGNTYTYGHLKKVSRVYPVPRPRKESRAAIARELKLPAADPKPAAPASAGSQATPKPAAPKAPAAAPRTAARSLPSKQRLYANPARRSAFAAGGRNQILDAGGAVPGLKTVRTYAGGVYQPDPRDVFLRRLRPGAKVVAGTILGRIGIVGDHTASHLAFEIRPAGRGAPRIDPKPILDGWKLLEATSIYRAAGKNPFFGPDAKDPSIGQVLLMSKEALQRRVLEDPRVDVYSCGRGDIRDGVVDRRILATIEFLASSGLRPTITSLECGHSYLTASGNVSEHSAGDAVDIAKVNGIPIVGHQGPGSITDLAIRRLLTLQGTMRPHQIISLMTYPGADNTLALPDHADHIHVGFRPLFGKGAQKFDSVLKPDQWIKLIDRLSQIAEPKVPTTPSKYSLQVKKPERASTAHPGE